MIAGASFVLCVACFAGATALGWNSFHNHHWGRDWSMHFGPGGRHMVWNDDEPTNAAGGPAGPAASRDIAWNGSDALDIDVPGQVDFTQAAGPGKITVTGPPDMVSHVVLQGTHLRLDDDGDFWGEVHVTVTAPAVRKFSISGSDTLNITGFDQDELDLDVSGSGTVTAAGKARATHIEISGSGQVDFGKLAVDAASASISGSGRATLSPATSADLHISGDGEIVLLSHPSQINSDVSGSGRIIEGQPQPAATAATTPPMQPTTPPPPATNHAAAMPPPPHRAAPM
jgi:hypothetical protein